MISTSGRKILMQFVSNVKTLLTKPTLHPPCNSIMAFGPMDV